MYIFCTITQSIVGVYSPEV